MTEIKNNETQENEVSPRECETKEDFDKALDKKEGEIRENIEHSLQEKNRAEYRAEQLGPISEEDKVKNAETRDKALEEKRQNYQDAVWQKNDSGDWKKNDINDKDYEDKEKAWSKQIMDNKRNELIDEMRPVADKTEKPEGSSETDKEASDIQKEKKLSAEEVRLIKEKLDGQAQNERSNDHGYIPKENNDDGKANEVESPDSAHTENNNNDRLKNQNNLDKEDADDKEDFEKKKSTLKETLASAQENGNSSTETKHQEAGNTSSEYKIPPEFLAAARLRQNQR